MAEIADQLPGELIESSWGNDIRDRTVQRYTTTIERDALNPSPADGDLAWILGQAELQIYSGSSPAGWRRYVPSSEIKYGYDPNVGFVWRNTFGDLEDGIPPNDGTVDFGPQVTNVDLYGGRLLVHVGAQADTTGDSLDGYMGVEVSGSGGSGIVVAASLNWAWQISGTGSQASSLTFVLDTSHGLPEKIEGVSVTAKYRIGQTSAGSTYARFFNRHLTVQPI